MHEDRKDVEGSCNVLSPLPAAYFIQPNSRSWPKTQTCPAGSRLAPLPGRGGNAFIIRTSRLVHFS